MSSLADTPELPPKPASPPSTEPAELNERQQTERALRQNQARLSAALATARLGIWEYDGATGLITWDERCREIFGFPDDRPRTREDTLQFVHPEDRERVAAEVAAALDPVKGGLFDTEYRISHPDGTTRWVLVRGQAVLESPGSERSPRRFTGTVLDITASKQANDNLRRSEERFRLATFSDTITLYEQDAELRYSWLYPLHPEHAHALGHSDLELMPDAQGQQLAEFKQEVIATGQSQRREIHSNVGGGRYYDVFITPRRDEAGRVIGVAGAALDVTMRKQAEEALRESEQRYRLLFDRNPDGVFSVDAQGRFTLVNPACEVISGYSRQELAGRHFGELCAPDQLARTLENFTRMLQDASYNELETALIRKDGRRVELWVAGEPIVKDGQPVAVHCTVKDITERKRFQAELERLVKERTAALQEMTDQLNAFVYTLAHDFRAPLKAQIAFADILVEDFGDALGETGRQFAQRIAEAATRQAALVNNLLQQVSLSREDLQLEVVDLRAAVEQALSDLALEIESKQATVEVDPVEGQVLANTASLHLILSNLLSNALKFVPEGVKPEVKVWTEPVSAVPGSPEPGAATSAPNAIRLSVQDNGIGIHPADQDRLFQAFQRLSSDPRYPGTGIGLAIVKKATERLGGRLGVESEPGKGSRFWLELQALTPK